MAAPNGSGTALAGCGLTAGVWVLLAGAAGVTGTCANTVVELIIDIESNSVFIAIGCIPEMTLKTGLFLMR
ncbi:hypothetical protein GCM10027577_49890 [Spirosoma fluminis]